MSITYTSKLPLRGSTIACKRCSRVHPFPKEGAPPIRCECGWWYEVRGGRIVEEFRTRIGGG
jgi:hypothetical protein